MKPNERAGFWTAGVGRAFVLLVFWIIVAGGLGVALALLFPAVISRLPFFPAIRVR
jgi:hypothetical protein